MPNTSFGSTEALLQPGYPKYSGDAKGLECEVEYRGATEAIMELVPEFVGGTIEGIEEIYTVVSWKHSPLGNGNDHQLSISLSAPNLEEPEVPPGEIVLTPPNYDVRFEEVHKRLESHPYFASLTSPGSTEIGNVERALNATTEAEATAIYNALSDLAKELHDEKIKGNDSFPIGTPIVVETRYGNGKPTLFGGNKREDPPAAAAAPLADENGHEYIYLRRPDSASKESRRWRVTRTWVGSIELSEIIYPP